LRNAVKVEDQLHYDEPPDWMQPCRHTLGAALLSVGKLAEAEAVYREDLRRLPHNGWSLLGLSQALARQGKRSESQVAFADFQRVWKGADVVAPSSCLCIHSPGK